MTPASSPNSAFTIFKFRAQISKATLRVARSIRLMNSLPIASMKAAAKDDHLRSEQVYKAPQPDSERPGRAVDHLDTNGVPLCHKRS